MQQPPATARRPVRLRSWLLALLLGGGVGTVSAEGLAFVRMQRLLDEAPQMQQARERIEQEFAEARSELTQLEANIAALKERDPTLLPAAEVEALKRRIDASERKLVRDRESLRSRVAARQNQLVDSVERAIGEVLGDLARERGVDVVLSADDVVLYGNPRLDLTDEVLARLQRATPPPAAPNR
ncbi:MAG: OmpH family outer membrane protein [Xanthomonadales bacterium]|nr:OmpH family outer membrane protein [Xanthomonadales bacterium]